MKLVVALHMLVSSPRWPQVCLHPLLVVEKDGKSSTWLLRLDLNYCLLGLNSSIAALKHRDQTLSNEAFVTTIKSDSTSEWLFLIVLCSVWYSAVWLTLNGAPPTPSI